jgi:hypothetical protein
MTLSRTGLLAGFYQLTMAHDYFELGMKGRGRISKHADTLQHRACAHARARTATASSTARARTRAPHASQIYSNPPCMAPMKLPPKIELESA